MSEIKTEIIMVLDRSGSMASCSTDVVGGFDFFIKEQKEGPGEMFVTLAQFDDKYEMVFEGIPIADVKPLKFQPRGNTALLDAIGKTIISSKERVKDSADCKAIIFVIVTDGHENCSTEFKKSQIASMTKECEENLGWKFIYLGANQDAFSESYSLGVASSGVMNYASSPDGTRSMFNSLSKGTKSYRSKLDEQYQSVGNFNVSSRSDLNKSDFFSEEDRKNNSKDSKTSSSDLGISWK